MVFEIEINAFIIIIIQLKWKYELHILVFRLVTTIKQSNGRDLCIAFMQRTLCLT